MWCPGGRVRVERSSRFRAPEHSPARFDLVYACRVHPIERRAAPGPEPRHRATGLERGAQPRRRFDYTTVGHVTVDVMPDGSRRPGGTAFYSALQASRLGLRTLVLTRGVASEIEELLEPYRRELQLDIQPAPETT